MKYGNLNYKLTVPSTLLNKYKIQATQNITTWPTSGTTEEGINWEDTKEGGNSIITNGTNNLISFPFSSSPTEINNQTVTSDKIVNNEKLNWDISSNAVCSGTLPYSETLLANIGDIQMESYNHTPIQINNEIYGGWNKSYKFNLLTNKITQLSANISKSDWMANIGTDIYYGEYIPCTRQGYVHKYDTLTNITTNISIDAPLNEYTTNYYQRPRAITVDNVIYLFYQDTYKGEYYVWIFDGTNAIKKNINFNITPYSYFLSADHTKIYAYSPEHKYYELFDIATNTADLYSLSIYPPDPSYNTYMLNDLLYFSEAGTSKTTILYTFNFKTSTKTKLAVLSNVVQYASLFVFLGKYNENYLIGQKTLSNNYQYGIYKVLINPNVKPSTNTIKITEENSMNLTFVK